MTITIYRAKFSELDALLQRLPANTSSTPYDIEITEITNAQCTGESTAVSGTLQYVLQKYIDTSGGNSTKYVKLYIDNDSGLTDIGNMAFYNCSNLVSIAIPITVSIIRKMTFSGCTKLMRVFLPNTITSIGERVFSGCPSLASITIPDSVTTIGTSAFAICTSLASITITNSVTTIGEKAFYGCTSLANIIFDGKIPKLDVDVFKACTNLTSVEFKGDFYQWVNVSSEDFESGFPSSLSTVYVKSPVEKQTLLYNTAFSTLSLPSNIVTRKDITDVPVEYISEAFRYIQPFTSDVYKMNFTNVKQSDLTGNENTIKDYLHTFSPIKVIINETAESYQGLITTMEGAFRNCTNLVKFSGFPNGVTNLNECFSGCTNLSEVT